MSYVIFSSKAEFDTAHEVAKISAGLPRVGRVAGRLAPQNQQTIELTSYMPHPSDSTVVAEINVGWPESLKADLTLKTKKEISIYYPEEAL